MSLLSMRGNLLVGASSKRPSMWTIRNRIRWSYLYGLFQRMIAIAVNKAFGINVMISELQISAKIDGEEIDFGTVGYRSVTTAGVAYMASNFANAGNANISSFRFHQIGSNGANEAAGDTGLRNKIAANRVDIQNNNGISSNNRYETACVATFKGGTSDVEEHGIFSQVNGGTLWDRTSFPKITVSTGDKINFKYVLTINAGT